MNQSQNGTEKILIGIDFGGTQGKFVVQDNQGHILHSQVLGNDQRLIQNSSEVSWRIQSVKEYFHFATKSFGPVQSIGLSFPGLATKDARVIQYLPGKLCGVAGVDWEKDLDLEVKVRVINDAQAALIAEAWIGTAQHKNHVVLLTLGTGVGGAFMINGQLVQGALGRAGHFGHVIIERHGPRDIFDVPGTLEWYLGNATIGHRTNYRWSSIEALIVDVKNSNQQAMAHWKEWIHNLSVGIVSILNSLDPELLVLSGGVTLAGDLLLDPLNQCLATIEWSPLGHRVPIALSKFQELGGAIGAAWFSYNY